MSRIPPSTGPSSSGHRSSDLRPLPPLNPQSLEQCGIKRKLSEVVSDIPSPNPSSSSSSTSLSLKAPIPWRPSSPSESRSSSPATRSIGVHAILNPPENIHVGDMLASTHARPEPLSRAPSVGVRPPPSLLSPTPQQRSVSSPITRLAKPGSLHLYHEPSTTISPTVSPLPHPRRIITPVSPAVRLGSASGKLAMAPGKVSVAQSPFVQEPSSGVYTVPPNLSIPIESLHNQPMNSITSTRSLPHHPPGHLTPTLHSRQSSLSFATNPSPQESSPGTPHSTYSQFGGPSSPSVTSTTGGGGGGGMLPHPKPPSTESLFSSVDGTRPVSQSGGPVRYGEDPSSLLKMSQPEMPSAQGLIPVFVDLKSGSRSQAEKRKANSDASRRFRNRKKNEMAMEQKISSLSEEVRLTGDERDFYRAERDFFREALSRAIGPTKVPPRPTSPRHFAVSADHAIKGAAATGEDRPQDVTDHQTAKGNHCASPGKSLLSPRQSAESHAAIPMAHPLPMAGSAPPAVPAAAVAAGNHNSAYTGPGHWAAGPTHDLQRQRDQLERSRNPPR